MKPRVLLITVVSKEYADIGDITLPNMQAYCEKHGYSMNVGLYHTDPARLDDYGDRGKIALFSSHINDYDMTMFLDVDALIMNSDIKIEDVLGNRLFLWTYGPDGPCSGFWIARSTPAVHSALVAVQSKAPLVGNVRTREEMGPPHKIVLEMEPRGQSDQEVMRSLMNIPPFSEVFGPKNCVSLKEAGHCFDFREIRWPDNWDHMGHYAPGDWLLTFPGCPLERRVELLREAARKAT